MDSTKPCEGRRRQNSFFIDINVTLTNLLAVLLINDRLKGYSTLHEGCEQFWIFTESGKCRIVGKSDKGFTCV